MNYHTTIITTTTNNNNNISNILTNTTTNDPTTINNTTTTAAASAAATIIPITTYSTSEWTHHLLHHHSEEEEERIREVLEVTYWIIIPIVVVLGIGVNLFGLYVLRRPRMKMLNSTPYLQLLLSLDVLVLVVSVATIFTLNGCHLHSYELALYFAHPFFTVFYMLQTFCQYIIVWICYDRFLALWCFQRFQQTQKPYVMRTRVFLTGVFCFLVNLRHFLDVEVVCMTDVGVAEAAENHTEGCDGGAWIILDTLHQSETRQVWQMIVWVLRGLIVIVMPVLLVLGFNSGTVYGLVRRRLHSMASTTRTRDQAYSYIYISLAISFTSIITSLPTVVHATFFAPNIQQCHGPLDEEIFRAMANVVLLGEHLTHFMFLAINQTFRQELRALLRRLKDGLRGGFALIGQTTGSSSSSCSQNPPRQRANVVKNCAPAIKNPNSCTKIPNIVLSGSEERSAVPNVAILTPTQISLSAYMAGGGELGGGIKKGGQVSERGSHLESDISRSSFVPHEEERI